MAAKSPAHKVRLAGVGASPQGKMPNQTADDLTLMAIQAALEDASITKDDIDVLIVQPSFGGQGEIREIGHRLGVEPAMAFNVGYQGEALLTAIHVIAAGSADVAVLAYGTNQRTNRNQFAKPSYHVGGNFETVYGLFSPGSTAAMNFRRRMHDYGATEEQLGAVAVAQSEAAALNPLAVYRDAITLEEYLAAPYVIAPLRRFDFCMISDGAFATVVMSEARAKDLEKRPIRLESFGYQTSFLEIDHPDAMYHPSQLPNAKRLWAATDLTVADLDAMYIQDAFSPNVLAGLENYGICERGTAHEWIQGGRISLKGELPVNPHGGQSRMTYMVGWHNTYDAVRQLRHEADEPARQVADCQTILCTNSGGHWQETFSMLLSR